MSWKQKAKPAWIWFCFNHFTFWL